MIAVTAVTAADQLRQLVQATDGPIGVAIVVVSLVGIIGWRYSRAQLGGKAPSKRAGGFGTGGLTFAVLALAAARVALLK